MAGIYIHIPFCKIKCHYCDFHFSTQHQNKNRVLDAMCREIVLRKNYLNSENIQTIYFGGGTPSLLTFEDFNQIMTTINLHYNLADDFEFTVECNPDDITPTKLGEFKTLGVNRLSIGIQSFDGQQLKALNRAHTDSEAKMAVQLAQSAGFQNITIDLIYGLPDTDEAYWQKQVDTAIKLNVPHISSYCLTFEPQTVFGNWLKKGQIKALADEANLAQFRILTQKLLAAGYDHYEISNFAKPGAISKHNSSYWLGEKYLGIGPSAHSFDGKTRQWNVANNVKYTKAVNEDISFYEVEELSHKDHFNEHILTRLRTHWGVDIVDLKTSFPDQFLKIQDIINKFLTEGLLIKKGSVILLSDEGKFIADHVTSELFIV